MYRPKRACRLGNKSFVTSRMWGAAGLQLGSRAINIYMGRG